MKTVDLGLPDNLVKLDFLVGIISGIDVKLEDVLGVKKCFYFNENNFHGALTFYCPTINSEQCLKATKGCNILWNKNKCYSKFNMHSTLCTESESELISRCLALVYSVYGNVIPDDIL